jgi:hypothetical protein
MNVKILYILAHKSRNFGQILAKFFFNSTYTQVKEFFCLNPFLLAICMLYDNT